MTVWISQLVGNDIEEQVTALVVEINNQILQDVHVRTMENRGHIGNQILGAEKMNKEMFFLN